VSSQKSPLRLLFGSSGGVFRRAWGLLGSPGPFRGVSGGSLGVSWGPLGVSWVPLGVSWDASGCLLGARGRLLGACGHLLSDSGAHVAIPVVPWAPLGELLCDPLAPPGASRRLQAPLGASCRLLAPPGASWRLPAPPGASRRLLAPPGASWRLLGQISGIWATPPESLPRLAQIVDFGLLRTSAPPGPDFRDLGDPSRDPAQTRSGPSNTVGRDRGSPGSSWALPGSFWAPPGSALASSGPFWRLLPRFGCLWGCLALGASSVTPAAHVLSISSVIWNISQSAVMFLVLYGFIGSPNSTNVK